MLAGEGFAAPLLDSALSAARRRGLSGRDAGLITHLVYGTLRHLPSVDAALAPLLRGKTPARTRTLLRCGTFEKLWLGTPAHAVVSEYVELARRAQLAPPGLVNAVLRRAEAVPGPASELPAWLEEEYRAVFGEEEAPGIFDDLLTPQPLWLWLRSGGEAALRDEGARLTPGPQGQWRAELTRPLGETAAFRQGLAQPINPASRACVAALGELAGGERVLDLAGGSGIKAALLAAAGAQVLSVDREARKHAAAQANLTRLGLSAEFLAHDLTQPLSLAPARAVLLDAPCTGSGTLRAHPEIKLRLTPEAVAEAAALQARMLPQAAAVTAPGGVLVYSLCSVTRAEGPEVVARFLADHPGFRPEPVPGLDLPHRASGDGVVTLPLGGVDGFFIARLRRVGD